MNHVPEVLPGRLCLRIRPHYMHLCPPARRGYGWWKNIPTTLFGYRERNFPAAAAERGGDRGSGMGGPQPANPGNLGMHLVAAYLNALMFPPNPPVPSYAYSPDQIISLYNRLDGKRKAQFEMCATTLENANNEFDHITGKPEAW